MITEERCECGALIPTGYGYYNLGQEIVCFNCGRVNKKDLPSGGEND